MALSANAKPVISGGVDCIQFTAPVKTSSVVYNGALCSFETLNGPVIPFDGGSTDVLAGWHFGDAVTGNTSAAVPPRATLKTGPFIYLGLTVGGSPSNSTADLGRSVYASDDGTYTITASGAAVGKIVAYYGAGVFDVAMKNVLGRYGTTTGGA